MPLLLVALATIALVAYAVVLARSARAPVLWGRVAALVAVEYAVGAALGWWTWDAVTVLAPAVDGLLVRGG